MDKTEDYLRKSAANYNRAADNSGNIFGLSEPVGAAAHVHHAGCAISEKLSSTCTCDDDAWQHVGVPAGRVVARAISKMRQQRADR